MTDNQFNQIVVLLEKLTKQMEDMNYTLSSIESNTGFVGSRGGIDDLNEGIKKLTEEVQNLNS